MELREHRMGQGVRRRPEQGSVGLESQGIALGRAWACCQGTFQEAQSWNLPSLALCYVSARWETP